MTPKAGNYSHMCMDNVGMCTVYIHAPSECRSGWKQLILEIRVKSRFCHSKGLYLDYVICDEEKAGGNTPRFGTRWVPGFEGN